jgi:hypothetical protein
MRLASVARQAVYFTVLCGHFAERDEMSERWSSKPADSSTYQAGNHWGSLTSSMGNAGSGSTCPNEHPRGDSVPCRLRPPWCIDCRIGVRCSPRHKEDVTPISSSPALVSAREAEPFAQAQVAAAA